MSTNDLFLDELKSHYNQEFNLKASLENKANYILVAAGITVTLLFTFGSAILEDTKSNYPNYYYSLILLMTSIILNALSILFSILAFAIRKYRFAMPYEIFFNKQGQFNETSLKEYRDGKGKNENESIQIFKKTMIEAYLRCNKQNGKNNDNKAIMIIISQWFFFVGVMIIPFVIGFVLFLLN